MEFLLLYERWILAFHVIAVLFWMAGIYYLPRLYVYHCEALENSRDADVFCTMEAKLIKIIMNPAMMAAWFFAILLIIRPGFLEAATYWFYIKLACVIALTGFHVYLTRIQKPLASGDYPKSSKFFRKINEIGPILTIIIVIMVIVRPV
jgi:putative membrane protein